jgi:hypothetical protein
MRDYSSFERGQIIRAHLAGASVTRSVMLLGLLRAVVFAIMAA